MDQIYTKQSEEEEDVWYQKEKLFKEHIQEVLDKWTQIDDEIWAKVIVFERNRRVAKAYARAPVLTVNGSDDGFDGMRIGLCGFDNPMRDPRTDELKALIGQGVKIKMDDAGNILVRRYSKSNVFVKTTSSSANDETAIGSEVLKSPNHAVEFDKVAKIFDMKKFQANLNRELSRAYPDRRRLETQCLSVLSFVKTENEILDCPIWILIVNVVAMDMLKSKLPPVHRPLDIKNRPRIPIPDEDPYSTAGGSSGSSGFGASGSFGDSSGRAPSSRDQQLIQAKHSGNKRSEKPPKLPPRDIYPQALRSDYNDIEDENRSRYLVHGKSDKGKDHKKYDDPYYCGMSARVPNFVKVNSRNSRSADINSNYITSANMKKLLKEKEQKKISSSQAIAPLSTYHQSYGDSLHMASQQQRGNMWHQKSYETGIDSGESPYQIYAKLPLPTRGYVPAPRTYIREWD